MKNEFTFIDLFAGIGGFRIALQNIGGKCLGFSEIAPDAVNTYCANFNESDYYNFGDIRKIQNLPEHDFLTAGVPCQSWSIAGKNLGFDDDRGQLWNDTLFLLNKCRPKVFIFENVKGLSDPRNKSALNYILERIKEAGYYAQKFVLNACDYGVPQTRVRIYIVGFKEEKYFNSFILPDKVSAENSQKNLSQQSLSCNEQGFNDYFLFNDLRGGETTIHSWDITETTDRQKHICTLLLKNRRKPLYGPLDGNPLSVKHFQGLDETIVKEELDELFSMKILKKVEYNFAIVGNADDISEKSKLLLSFAENGVLNYDTVKNKREIKINKIDVYEELQNLTNQGIIRCIEERYDFKNSKISTGLNGINRIFLPSAKIYPTLVASDTNDYVSTVEIKAETMAEYREKFLREIYFPKKFRKISKHEACKIQGFPEDFLLPESRPRWMKLIGNSVSVPIVQMLAQAIASTGVFDEQMVKFSPKISEDNYKVAVNM